MMFEEMTNSSEVVTINNTSSSSLMRGGTTITSSMNVEMIVATTSGLEEEVVSAGDFILNTSRISLVDTIKTNSTTDSRTIVTSSRQHGET